MDGPNCIADAMHYICFSCLRDISNELIAFREARSRMCRLWLPQIRHHRLTSAFAMA
jgi:hypothetical protein